MTKTMLSPVQEEINHISHIKPGDICQAKDNSDILLCITDNDNRNNLIYIYSKSMKLFSSVRSTDGRLPFIVKILPKGTKITLEVE